MSIKKTMTQAEITDEYGISRTTLWRWRRQGSFPAPVCFPSGSRRFDRKDVEKFFESMKDPNIY